VALAAVPFGGPLADHVGLELGQPGEEDDHQSPDRAVHVGCFRVLARVRP
jgi:hypothetical protein